MRSELKTDTSVTSARERLHQCWYFYASCFQVKSSYGAKDKQRDWRTTHAMRPIKRRPH